MVSVNFDNFLGGFTGFYLMDSGKVYEFEKSENTKRTYEQKLNNHKKTIFCISKKEKTISMEI